MRSFFLSALVVMGCSAESVVLSTPLDATVDDATVDASDAGAPDVGCSACCADDMDCAAMGYCSDAGRCLQGCRAGGCGEDVCDSEARQCVPPGWVCCSGRTCRQEADCEGLRLPGVTSCEGDPCRGGCEADSQCDASDYCAAGICTPGCRDAAGACGASRTCNLESRRCQALPCDLNEQCPDYQYCTDSTGLCTDGCRDDNSCGAGSRCDDGDCVAVECDTPSEGLCVDTYCDAQGRLRPCCEAHEACVVNAACTPLGRCEIGACRFDDFEPNDSPDAASPLELRAIGGGRGTTLQAMMCAEGADHYLVELQPGERLLARMEHAGPENLDLRVTGPGLAVQLSDGINTPEMLESPPPGTDALGGTYAIEVFGRAEVWTAYSLSVVTDATGCFPDERDVSVGGDASPETAFELGEEGSVDGVVCPEDEDFFALNMGLNDGLELELVATPGSDALRIELLSPPAVAAGQPDYRVVDAIAGSDGPTYLFSRPAGSAAFSDARWVIRVLGVGGDDVARYTLRYRVIRRDVCPPDGAEPDNSLATALDLDGLEALVDDAGRIRFGEDLVVPVAGRSICPLDNDFQCFVSSRGDQISAWAVGGGVGAVTVEFVDGAGQIFGQTGEVTVPNAPTAPASTRASPGGRVCIRVAGVGAVSRSYSLWLRREPPAIGCRADPESGNAVRDDIASRAWPLLDVSGGVGRRYADAEGYLCDVAEKPDVDWRSFGVASPRSRVCVAIDGAVADGALKLEVFAPDAAAGVACDDVTPCEAPTGCIEGRCRAPAATRLLEGGGGAAVFSKAEVGDHTGSWLARVTRREEGVDTAYRLTATVEAEVACVDDWRELGAPNDQPGMATYLGAGATTVCDAWICESERLRGDAYRITVPPGVDRSVYIDYQSNTDGRLFLEAQAPVDGGDPFDGFRISQDAVGNRQCVTLVGGAAEAEVELRVLANLARSDGEPVGRARVDYVLRVVEVDFEQDETDGCGESFSACPEEDPFAPACWPWVTLP